MIILLVLRRLSPRGRRVTGAVLMALGAGVLAASGALSVNLYVHGAILMILGAACYLRANAVGRRGRSGAQ
jgi:drug/metabolite transporter (DMT)-like permease